jgi:hypothetical protein
MATVVWCVLAVAAAALVGYRLRTAARKLTRILDDFDQPSSEPGIQEKRSTSDLP